MPAPARMQDLWRRAVWNRTPAPVRRAVWFVALWVLGVGATAVVAYAIRLMIMPS